MARIINIILISVAGFLLCFTWLVYYKQALWICYTVSALLAIMFFVVLFVLEKRSNMLIPGKRVKKSVSDSQKKALACLTDYAVFLNIFQTKGYSIKRLSDEIYLIENTKNTSLIVFNFKLSNVGAQDVINAYKLSKKNTADNIVLFCLAYDAGAKEMCRMLDKEITFMDFNSAKQFLRANQRAIELPQPEKRVRFFESKLFYYAFNRSRFKYYFFSAVFLLLLSRISFYSLYNISIATVSFVLSLYCLVNKRFNSQTEILKL
jgi:hypothetical protein